MEDQTRTYKCVRNVDEGVEVCDWVPLWGIRRCNSAICGGHRRWNRDHNAAINIRANLMHYAESGAWPQHATGHRTMTTVAMATTITTTTNAVATA